MVGCPDSSVTGNGRVVWLEYKFDYLKPWMEKGSGSELAQRLLVQHSKGAEAQRSMMDRLGRASASLYIMWVHKTACYVIDPVTLQSCEAGKLEHLCDIVMWHLEGWKIGGGQVDFVGL